MIQIVLETDYSNNYIDESMLNNIIVINPTKTETTGKL